jgi:hypothetical protein
VLEAVLDLKRRNNLVAANVGPYGSTLAGTTCRALSGNTRWHSVIVFDDYDGTSTQIRRWYECLASRALGSGRELPE